MAKIMGIKYRMIFMVIVDYITVFQPTDIRCFFLKQFSLRCMAYDGFPPKKSTARCLVLLGDRVAINVEKVLIGRRALPTLLHGGNPAYISDLTKLLKLFLCCNSFFGVCGVFLVRIPGREVWDVMGGRCSLGKLSKSLPKRLL